MTAATLAIEASGLAKRFGATRAVDGIDVAVPRGGVFGLLGPNGAGKTTTIRIFATLTRPDSGSARVLANEPDLLTYYAYLDEDSSEASLVQIHRNASSADHHMEITAEKIAQGLAVTTTVRAEVYGTPGGRQLTVRGLDAVNQTPVLDIKPVMRQLLPTKAHQTAWVAALMTDYFKPSTASRGAASQRRP